MAANLLSYNDDEGLPVVKVSSSSNGNVTLKWGQDGAQQTTASLSTSYADQPYELAALDSSGNELVFQTFGSLLGCNGGRMTLRGSRYQIQVEQPHPPPLPLQQDPSGSKKLEADQVAEAAAVLVRRMELASRRGRPQRILSYVTKSHAFQTSIVERRVSFDVPFFFELIDTRFDTDAFTLPGPVAGEDETTVHHSYFLRELRKLIASAVAAGILIRQRVYLSRAGKWLSLDDGISVGVEPDFCTTDVDPTDTDTALLVPCDIDPVSPPASKYDVELTLEAKQSFTETDQMEAIDSTERVLCIQRGRSAAYGALFHCRGSEKVIRWIKTWEVDGEFRSEISSPAMIGPGLAGLKQLVTMLTKSRQELGRPFPSRVVSTITGEILIIQSCVGEGATSRVFVASTRGGSIGVVKMLKPGHEARASREVNVLYRLEQSGVSGIVSGELVTQSIIYFPKLLTPADVASRKLNADLVSLLEASHAAGVIHRDVRPDNIMVDEAGLAYIIDWGCAYVLEESSTTAPPPLFEGTFRFASDAALAAATLGKRRVPEPKDDLESLVRSVLALNSPDILGRVHEIRDGDFEAAKRFWDTKKQSDHFVKLCEAAQRLDYEFLRNQTII